VHYSSGLYGVASLATGTLLPFHGLLWTVARCLLDASGGLFLLYLAVLWTLVLRATFSRRTSTAPAATGAGRPRGALSTPAVTP
jgi:hypothetical protein